MQLDHWPNATLLTIYIRHRPQATFTLRCPAQAAITMSRALTLPEVHSTQQPSPKRWCIHQVFERQASQTPNAIAVTFGGTRLTYRELNERANRLAHYLQRLGVQAEVPVALYLERSLDMVVAILGVLKAGGAYVPIDLAYPQERRAFMLEDAQAPVLLTQESLRAALPSAAAGVVCLDSAWAKISAESPVEPVAAVTSDNAAYIIYTSGSTGKPKGVLVTHHNVVRLLDQTAHWYGFNEHDVWPLFHSYAFDVSVWELWGSLFHGGRLVVVPYLVTRSPGEFYELLAREKVTVLNQTPSAFRQLIWAEQNASLKHDLHLRYVICAGEALELQSLKPWFERHGDQKPAVVNMYGITETTVHSTYRVIRQADLTSGVGSVIGVPIPDLQIYLVDEDLRPVPSGVPGEICVGGAGVARGYLKRPELTQKRFLPDPFASQPGARMYRSGDLAQINAKGELEYLGRMDHQVKIRGFRVELGEIESALNGHPAIRESVVIAQDSGTGDKRLVAYFVPRATAPNITEMREYLGKKLPDYMVPAVFVSLPSLPLTTNGKVDRRALPSPDGARPELRSQFVAPQTPPEKVLAKIWEDVLELERVGINDNFFELGGDSIRSITILSRAREQGLHLTVEQIFRQPTIAQLARCAEAAPTEAPPPSTEPFSLVSAEDRGALPQDIVDAYPLSRLQLGMFYHNELNPLSAMYHDVFSYRVEAPFDATRLREAVQRLASRHPLLRTSFELARFSRALQLVHREVLVPFTSEDLRSLSRDEQDRKVVDWIESEKRRPFDRRTAPLVRFHAQQRGDASFQLIISFHHACLDGWSLAAVITELCQDYTALLLQDAPVDATASASGPPAESLTAPRVTYRDFVALEQQAVSSENHRRFWTEKLEGSTSQSLPRWPKAFRVAAEEQVRGPEKHVDDQTLAGLKALAQAAGVPLKTVLLAAHQRVMSLLYGQTDVISALICNGRPEQIDGEKIVGLFLNALPLRQQLQGGTWMDLVKQTFNAEQEMMPHRRFPLSEVQKLAGGRPLFESAFDFVHFHVYKNLQGLRGLDLAEGHYFEANNLTSYTTFMLDVTSTKLELHIDYDPNALCRRQIEAITDYYLHTLRAMATDANGRYEQFSPLAPAELEQMLGEWNATREDYPRDACLHELFERQANKTPNALALVFGDQRLNYFELNKRADHLAARLRTAQVKSGSLVGICLERSPEMIVALLATLKTGAAYVPLDPTYPKERLAFMVEDSKLALLLTQSNLMELLPPNAAPMFCVDQIDHGAAFSRDLNEPHRLVHGAASNPESLAYVIYTSGSTGRPKGVQVIHRAVINVLTSIARRAAITNRDNLLAVTTLSFDIAGLELFLPLITGGCVTLASREQAGDGTKLAVLLDNSGATVMQGTPATWRLLLESGWRGNRKLKVFCGGEALKRTLADDLLGRAGEVWNFYGPTETTIWSTAWKVAPGEPIAIGRPLANTRLYILDALQRAIPAGAVGEICLGGDGLALGYLERPELTAEKFIPDPFARAAGARLYRTGDLGRFRPDGTVECLGRIDHQVKIRGFRIELGEVEAALRLHSGIAEVLVTTRDDSFGDKRLVAYVKSKNGPIAPNEIRDFVKGKLPHYMVPAYLVPIAAFPLTPNGKIDLRRLPAPQAVGAPRDYRAPRNTTEQTVAQIWQDVLTLNQIGLTDNFFELGGDSLSATRAFARINRTFSTDFTLREMLEHPTLGALADIVTRRQGSRPVQPAGIPRLPRAKPC